MKNNLITIMKKEFARFFGDRRMVVTVLLLPGLMIYAIYSFMGSAMTDQFQTDDTYTCNIAFHNLPDSIETILDSGDLPINRQESEGAFTPEDNLFLAQVKDMELDLLVVFPENFDELVRNYNSGSSSQFAPNIDIYFNTASTESGTAYEMITSLLDAYETALANKFDINNSDLVHDLASAEDTSAQIFSMMLPMLLMTFLFSACTSIAPESIAGEKERGTIATLLVTPMKRSSLAMGKIFSLSTIALLGGLSSFLGTMLSIPKLMEGSLDGLSASVYGVIDYVLLLLVILSTVLVMISAIAVISTLAKTVKEASTMIMPLMIIVMLIGVSGMFTGGTASDAVMYLIPLYNSAQCMSGIFSFSYDAAHIAITVGTNLLCCGVLVGVLTKMFNSEKIMY